MSYILTKAGAVRMGLQGINTPDTGATLTSTDIAEFEEGFFIKTTPDRQAPKIISPKRQGQGLDTVGNSFTWGGSYVMRDFTVPATDTGARPSDHAMLRAMGMIETYDNNGGAGPYKLIYIPQDAFEKMDLATLELWEGSADEVDGIKHRITGGMSNGKFKLEPGFCRGECDGGIAQTYTEADEGSAIPIDPTPTTQRLMLQGATVLIETVDSTVVYSGPVAMVEIDMRQLPGAIRDGTAAGFIDRATLNPKEAILASLTIARQLLADFHAQKIRDIDRKNLHVKVTVPTLGNSNNTRYWDLYGSIGTIDKGPELGSGSTSDKINLSTLWHNALTPGVTPSHSMVMGIETAV